MGSSGIPGPRTRARASSGSDLRSDPMMMQPFFYFFSPLFMIVTEENAKWEEEMSWVSEWNLMQTSVCFLLLNVSFWVQALKRFVFMRCQSLPCQVVILLTRGFHFIFLFFLCSSFLKIYFFNDSSFDFTQNKIIQKGFTKKKSYFHFIIICSCKLTFLDISIFFL